VDLPLRHARDTPENEVLGVAGHAHRDGARVIGGDQQEQEGQRVYVVVSNAQAQSYLLLIESHFFTISLPDQQSHSLIKVFIVGQSSPRSISTCCIER
jgi:hypothetical protein